MSGSGTTEPLAAVPVSELRNLADVLSGMDIDLADDYVAGLANRLLRDLARRWADTVRVWAVEAELWGEGPEEFLRQAVTRVASTTGRSANEIVAGLAAHFGAPDSDER